MRALSSLLIGIVAVAMAFASPTMGARPISLPPPEDVVRLDLCAFPVDFHYLQWGAKSTTHEDGTGAIVTITTGVAKVRLTNLGSGESLDLNISGTGTLRVRPDGSFVFTGNGPWLFSDVPPGLGLPPLFWTSGHFEVHADTDGNLVSFERVGHLVDLCAELAG